MDTSGKNESKKMIVIIRIMLISFILYFTANMVVCNIIFSNIKSLFESVLSSHPIGTVLLLEIEKENPLMAWTSFSEIIPTDNRTLDYEGEDKNPPQYLVLDGQQRLTSLSHLTRGTNNHIWYLDLNGVKQRWEEVEAPSNKEEIKNFIEQELDVFAFIKKKKRTKNHHLTHRKGFS